MLVDVARLIEHVETVTESQGLTQSEKERAVGALLFLLRGMRWDGESWVIAGPDAYAAAAFERMIEGGHVDLNGNNPSPGTMPEGFAVKCHGKK